MDELPTESIDSLTELEKVEVEEVIVIEVKSEYDPELVAFCAFDNSPTVQQQINYQFRLHKKTFEVRDVWCNSCSQCNQKFFANKTSDEIGQRVFEIQYEKEHQFGLLLSDDTE